MTVVGCGTCPTSYPVKCTLCAQSRGPGSDTEYMGKLHVCAKPKKSHIQNGHDIHNGNQLNHDEY
jgi:hypothetical protein